MRYFYILELWHSLEEFRLKNGLKLANFLKNLVNVSFIIFQNFWSKKNFTLITLFLMIGLSLLWRSFDVNLQANFLKLNYSSDVNRLFSPLVFAIKFLSQIAENSKIDQVLLAEIVFNCLGILLAIFCSINLSKSLICEDIVTKNILLFSLVFSYFFGLSFKIFSFEINLLKFLVIIYLSLSLRENVKSNFFVNLLAIFCGVLLVLSKCQLIFLVLAFELMQFFSLKKEFIKYRDDQSLICYLRLRYTLNLIARVLLTSVLIIILMLNKKLVNLTDIFEQVRQFDFENYKFFSSQIINKLFQENNSQGFFAILSRDILLVFLLLIISRIKIYQDNKTLVYGIVNIFFIIFFIASFFMILLKGYDDKILKILFFNLNIPLVLMVFCKSLIEKKINLKKHYIVLLMLVSLAIGDYYVFFEIIFYLPFLWFIIHLIFLKRITKKISEAFDYQDLNVVDRLFLLKDLRLKIIFMLFIIASIYYAFYVNFFVICFVNILIFCYQLVFFEKINTKILKNNQYHFLISVLIVLTITYLSIISLKGFDLMGQKHHSFFINQQQDINTFVVEKLSKLLKQEDQIVIVDDQNTIDLNSLVLKTKLSIKDIIILSNFSDIHEFSKLANKKIKFLLINNSFIFNNESCLISKFEQLMRIPSFRIFYTKNFQNYGHYLASYNAKDNYSFYYNKIDNLSLKENFIIYDYYLLHRK